MNIEKLINTMAEIIGEKHNIKVTAKIQRKGDFLHYEGVVKYDGQNKNQKGSGIYKGVDLRAS